MSDLPGARRARNRAVDDVAARDPGAQLDERERPAAGLAHRCGDEVVLEDARLR